MAVEAFDRRPTLHGSAQRKELVAGHRYQGGQDPVDVEPGLGIGVLVAEGQHGLRIHRRRPPVDAVTRSFAGQPGRAYFPWDPSMVSHDGRLKDAPWAESR
jgi:hypothetical protein